eukprot:9008559-Lingulodinium_polyedra.AAC.1
MPLRGEAAQRGTVGLQLRAVANGLPGRGGGRAARAPPANPLRAAARRGVPRPERGGSRPSRRPATRSLEGLL